MSDKRWRTTWALILLGTMILSCVVVLLEERDARAVLKRGSIDSRELAEIWGNYYQGDQDDGRPVD